MDNRAGARAVREHAATKETRGTGGGSHAQKVKAPPPDLFWWSVTGAGKYHATRKWGGKPREGQSIFGHSHQISGPPERVRRAAGPVAVSPLPGRSPQVLHRRTPARGGLAPVPEDGSRGVARGSYRVRGPLGGGPDSPGRRTRGVLRVASGPAVHGAGRLPDGGHRGPRGGRPGPPGGASEGPRKGVRGVPGGRRFGAYGPPRPDTTVREAPYASRTVRRPRGLKAAVSPSPLVPVRSGPTHATLMETRGGRPGQSARAGARPHTRSTPGTGPAGARPGAPGSRDPPRPPGTTGARRGTVHRGRDPGRARTGVRRGARRATAGVRARRRAGRPGPGAGPPTGAGAGRGAPGPRTGGPPRLRTGGEPRLGRGAADDGCGVDGWRTHSGPVAGPRHPWRVTVRPRHARRGSLTRTTISPSGTPPLNGRDAANYAGFY